MNLDAMIKREDFATTATDETQSYENVATISLRDFTAGGFMGPSLRKPDFQRETNHWAPEQVVSLLECFVSGDLIPSVILWKSPTYLFVIDGGHRLSALRAWVEDDYGDGPTSQAFFGYQIAEGQRKAAETTRALIAKSIGTWQHYQARISDEALDLAERRKLTAVVSRGLPIQWVNGDADKAESSFFKINTKGTPLDDIEELLLKNRAKPASIAARAIIRSGRGHRYWSRFSATVASEIEAKAKSLHSALFDPEIERPIKTLDLPLGGPRGIRTALEALIDLMLIAERNQQGDPKSVEALLDDPDGTATVKMLSRALALVGRITGNDKGSLGLHPAVYFYGPTGRHSGPMFMGTVALIGSKLANNDKQFFARFTEVRSKLEEALVAHKDLISIIIQRTASSGRSARYTRTLGLMIDALKEGQAVGEADLVRFAGMEGKILVGTAETTAKNFSDDTKSAVFIQVALNGAIKCPICDGYLDPEKSVSYDHVLEARNGGKGSNGNLQLTHPYCNQSVKN
ncbi:DUF262 domain-containing protein [Roseateles microcysteis]|uniref:DUF262 domain-containing protein n=1 Tax=Roseateles microcysteis TaxID=3119057 RepID=UPI002FE69554